MKSIIIIFILIASVKVAHAQTPEDEKSMIDNIQTVKPKSLKGTFPQARFSHITDKGTVYALPLDNMPCLVPVMKSNMPIAKSDIQLFRKIPNASPEYKIIPGTELPNTTTITELKK